jgi:hypothetical protein
VDPVVVRGDEQFERVGVSTTSRLENIAVTPPHRARSVVDEKRLTTHGAHERADDSVRGQTQVIR